MKSSNHNSEGQQKNDKYQHHRTDLKEAIFYLPRNIDQNTLIRALKVVYPNDGQSLMVEWLIKTKNDTPKDLEETWQNSSLTLYQEKHFDTWLKKELYDVAEKTGWVPKALRKGKQAKRPPRRREQKQLEQNIESTKELKKNLLDSREKGLPENQKTQSQAKIVNRYGGCYKQPRMLKNEIPNTKQEYQNKCTLLVDCEVSVLDAVEYVMEKYGREPDKTVVKYRIRLNNKAGENKIVQATHEDLTTVSRFSSFLVSKGFVKFQGTRKEFDEFHFFLLKEQTYPMVKSPSSWGEHKPGVFLFENGIYCTKSERFYPANEEQQIPYKNTYLACPSGSEQVKPPKYKPVTHDSLEFLTETFLLWESFNGPINVRSTIGYAMGCVFSQQIIDKYGGFPMLFKYGVRGTGKSTSMDWFMALFGYQDGNRQGVTRDNTKKGILRKLTLVKSFPFFFDDFRHHETNSEAPDLTNSFLNWYTRIGTSMAEKSTDHQTIDTQMKSSIVLTGNDKPTDAAALSRMIILNFNTHIKKEKIQDVNNISSKSERLSEFIALILKNYEMLRHAFFDCFTEHKTFLANKNFEGRTANNWACILAGVECLKLILPDLGWHEELKGFREAVCRKIRLEQEMENSQSELLEFFETLDYFSSEKKHPDAEFQEERFFLDRHHFQLTSYTSKDHHNSDGYFRGPVIALHIPGIWNALKHANADITRQTSRRMIEERMQNSDLFVDKSVTVYMYRSHKGSDKKNTRCYLLDLDKLEKQGLLDDLINKAKQHQINL
jgi:hypothetical protein